MATPAVVAEHLPPITLARLVARDGRACWHCGTTETLTVQHRGVKGLGGRLSAERPSNGIILCWAFNHAVEADPGAAEWARHAGWKISSHADPAAVPVFEWAAQRWWLLDDQWGKAAVP